MPLAEFRAVAQRQRAQRQAEHARELRAWRQRSIAVRQQPQWYPVWLPGGIDRVDVAGGTLAGWSALLTSVAAPRLAAGDEVTVLDLTEGGVATDLLALARRGAVDPLVWILPADLPRFDKNTIQRGFVHLRQNSLKNLQIDRLPLTQFTELEFLEPVLEPLQPGKLGIEREAAVIADLAVVLV